jgi:tungstate transport system substrate-binding protein
MLKALCVLAVLALVMMAGNSAAATRIKCASTTSTLNSGLFDYLLPQFEKKTGIHVDIVAVGTGAAI